MLSLDIANLANELRAIASVLAGFSTGLAIRTNAAATAADDLACRVSALEQAAIPSAAVVNLDSYRDRSRLDQDRGDVS